MKVWIDLSNSPHPLLFAPVARRLEADGHRVLITARDNAQTIDLTLERWPQAEVIGGHSPRGKVAKAQTLARRIAQLRQWGARTRPDVALSHNSYAQIVAAKTLGVPAVTAMDFEHQPANHLAFRLATTVVVPEVLPLAGLRRQGATAGKLIRYAGLKEELYIGDFEPDAEILRKVGFTVRPPVVAVVRTPPSRALYHPSTNPMFEGTLRTLCEQPDVVCIALTRDGEQVTTIEALGLPNCVVPRTAIDSRSLMYAADVMVGAGGTMTREAALMGIRTWTLFVGTAPAVDLWLERQGRLARLHTPRQLAGLEPRRGEPRTPGQLRERAEQIERVLVQATVTASGEAPAAEHALAPA